MDFTEYIYDILNSTEVNTSTSFVRLFVSFALGAIVGTERQRRRQVAGLRTFTLICLGSTAAMLISIWIPQIYPNFLNGDPGRIAAQVLTGIGFLGAGAIIQSHGSIHGLTTAACIWVVAVIGLAVGAGMYIPAVITTFLTVSVLISLDKLERRMVLDGVNKILTISCATAEPDLTKMREILERQNVYILTTSYSHNYLDNTSELVYKVNVQAKSSYKKLFAAIHSTGYVTAIKIQA